MKGTPQQSWSEVTHLFEAALELRAEARSAFLERACAGDAELRREVQSLLEADAQAGKFLDVLASEAEPPTSGTTVLSEDGATLPSVGAPEEQLKPGAPLGRYFVRERLGTGGMGVVYLADDPELNRKIALKLMRPGASENISASEGRARLMREAQAMAQLSHPNVIAVYDVGTFGEEVFIAMEYVEGSTLTKWLAEQDRPWREIINMFVQTGRGLAAAHAAGILHRDFKPDNVLVGKDGRPRVLDFGLARALFGEPEKRAPVDESARTDASSPSNLAPLGLALTEPGRVMGTPAYMAPEQLMRQGADHRTDQYSFCVGLYQGLFGELPFKGQSIQTLVRKMSQRKAPEAPSSEVPQRLRRVVLRGLRPQPAERYPSMDALIDELVLQAARTRRRLVAVAVLAMVGAIAALGGVGWKNRNTVLTKLVAELTPNTSPRLVTELGASYFRLGMTSLAIACFERAISIEPTWASYNNLATALYQQGKYAEAIKMYRKAIELAPSEARLWGSLADAYRYVSTSADEVRDNYARAIELTEKELAINQKDQQKRARMATWLVFSDKRRALEEIRQALAFSPQDNFVQARAALVFEQSGMREEALAAVEGALELRFPMAEIKGWPPLAQLRQDPRFAALVPRTSAGNSRVSINK